MRMTIAIGARIVNSAVAVNVFEVQPPHFRYQANVNTKLTTQAAKTVIPTHLMLAGGGFDGRSGLMNRRTSGKPIAPKGTLIQNIQRHESCSLTIAVSSGVVGRVA